MPLTFPNGGDGAGQTTTYQYTYNGITQNWVWGASITVNGAPGPSAWIMQGFALTAGEDGGQGNQGFQGVQGFQGFQGFRGFQGFQGNIGPSLTPAGNNREIQYKDNDSFGANSLATIATDSNLVPSAGYSGNFLNYSESVLVDDGEYSNGNTVVLDFDSYKIYRATNINLTAEKTLTFSGFSTATTGQSLTLILGHSGGQSSQIAIPGTENIFWPEGPLGNLDGGQTAYISPESTRKYDILYFFSDGSQVYGNYSLDFRKS